MALTFSPTHTYSRRHSQMQPFRCWCFLAAYFTKEAFQICACKMVAMVKFTSQWQWQRAENQRLQFFFWQNVFFCSVQMAQEEKNSSKEMDGLQHNNEAMHQLTSCICWMTMRSNWSEANVIWGAAIYLHLHLKYSCNPSPRVGAVQIQRVNTGTVYPVSNWGQSGGPVLLTTRGKEEKQQSSSRRASVHKTSQVQFRSTGDKSASELLFLAVSCWFLLSVREAIYLAHCWRCLLPSASHFVLAFCICLLAFSPNSLHSFKTTVSWALFRPFMLLSSHLTTCHVENRPNTYIWILITGDNDSVHSRT